MMKMEDKHMIPKRNQLRLALSVAACKVLRFILRMFGQGGTNLPGKLALKICPDVLSVASKGMHIVVVSGTNGKTTTCRMIEQGVRDAGLDYIANRSGANLLAGITAEFVANARWNGAPTKQYAVIECDEATLIGALNHIKPEVIVLTNIFRDQLDRYGEVTHTLNILKSAVEKTPNARLCLNADDSLIASIGQDLPNECVYYGMNAVPGRDHGNVRSDAMYCIRCKHRYAYRYVTYGHLGGFCCPNCGYQRPEPQVFVEQIRALNREESVVDVNIHGLQSTQTVPVPGIYNVYNFLAGITALDAMGIPIPKLQMAGAFGRMEHFGIGKGITMILVKNPTGFSQVIEYLTCIEEEFDLMCCLNDRDADGTDISWIWDVSFERLASISQIEKIYVSGTRKEDLYLRLKYAGIDESDMILVEDEDAMVRSLTPESRPMVITPTYTAMMSIRKPLAKRCGRKDFWK